MTEQTVGVLGPESAAVYAMRHGGFTTPANEAFRILEDARRHLKQRGSAAESGEAVEALDATSELWTAVRNTLVWIWERLDDQEVVYYATRWIPQDGQRYVTTNVLCKAAFGCYVYELSGEAL